MHGIDQSCMTSFINSQLVTYMVVHVCKYRRAGLSCHEDLFSFCITDSLHRKSTDTEIIFRMRPTNERQCYIVTSSLIGWAHTQNDPCWSRVGVTMSVSSIPLFFPFFWIIKNRLPYQYHIHIWQLSLQLSCSDSCQIWMWSNQYPVKQECPQMEKFSIVPSVAPIPGDFAIQFVGQSHLARRFCDRMPVIQSFILC